MRQPFYRSMLAVDSRLSTCCISVHANTRSKMECPSFHTATRSGTSLSHRANEASGERGSAAAAPYARKSLPARAVSVRRD